MVQIKITSKAKKDIRGIYNYIIQDSYQNAEMVAEAIIRKIETLKRQSDLGKIVKEFDDPKIRELKLFKYRIYLPREINVAGKDYNNPPQLKIIEQ